MMVNWGLGQLFVVGHRWFI